MFRFCFEQVEDGRTKELAHELKCRMEDLRRLQATQIRVEERCRELEKRKIETQERLERERSERLKAEAMERDRASSSNDLQRGHQDEAALAASVLDKLRNDVKLEIDQRQQAEEALAQAMAGKRAVPLNPSYARGVGIQREHCGPGVHKKALAPHAYLPA